MLNEGKQIREVGFVLDVYIMYMYITAGSREVL
jgi:hypothetical protein